MRNPINKLKRKGIAALAKMHFFGNPSKRMKIIGVTGTNGKTTTTTLLYKITTALGYKAGLIGTVEIIINGEHIPAVQTTPGPINLYRMLNEMADKGCQYVFMEVSSHGLDQNRVAGLNFAGAIFTNLTHDHLDYHKDFDSYFHAKRKLFDNLPLRSFALSNADDEYGRAMVSKTKAYPFLYGFTGGEFEGRIEKIDFSGLSLKFNDIPIHSNLLGKFNAYNLLAVWSACSLLNFDMDKVNEIIKDIAPPKGRFEYFTTKKGVMVVVDYAHTPDAIENIFTSVREILPEGKKLISLFGCGGDRDPLKRPIMGKLGASMSEIAIFTSDNPRSEDPNKIIKAMTTELSSEELKKVKEIPDRREAIKESLRLAQEGDIILCAGKGHEDYQEIKGVKHHFDDMEEFRALD